MGINFLSYLNEMNNSLKVLNKGFRPHIEDYFFKVYKANNTIQRWQKVSVPLLGIIFLSLPFIVMITSKFKLRLSVESLQRYP